MKLYYSNLGSVKFEPGEIPPVGVLDSFATISKPKVYHWADSHFLDSGAYTAANSGHPIDLQKYIGFLKKCEGVYSVVASLDVIGDHEASWANHLRMREAGLHPMPAYHMGEPMSALQRMVDAGEAYIGLGGAVGSRYPELTHWLRGIFQRFPDPAVVGFHGYGMVDVRLLREFPWRSCDAASVHRVARYGGVWNPFGMRFYICPFDKSHGRGDVITNPNERKVLQTWVESLGYNWELACSRNNDGLKERCKISIAYFESVAKEVPTRYTITHPQFIL